MSSVVQRRWAFYWRALEGDFSQWDSGEAPWPGFFRCRYYSKDLWRPVAIWDANPKRYRADRVLANVGVKTHSVPYFRAEPVAAVLVWSDQRCWRHPVTEEQYRHALQHGDWHDTLRAKPDAGEHVGRMVTNLREAAVPAPPPQPKGER